MSKDDHTGKNRWIVFRPDHKYVIGDRSSLDLRPTVCEIFAWLEPNGEWLTRCGIRCSPECEVHDTPPPGVYCFHCERYILPGDLEEKGMQDAQQRTTAGSPGLEGVLGASHKL